jgi:hypothetical protein
MGELRLKKAKKGGIQKQHIRYITGQARSYTPSLIV